MNQKESKVVREAVGNIVSETVNYEGFKFEGFTSEGVAFSNGEDVFVVRTIVKSETFDLAEALESFQKAQAKAAERAAKTKTK